MKVVHVSETDLGGGAGIYAFRLHRALRAAGVESFLVVSRKLSDDPHVIAVPTPDSRFATTRRMLREHLEQLPRWRYRHRLKALFSTTWATTAALRKVRELRPDLVNLHWIGHGFFPASAVPSLGTPVVWTLHDMWPFTGGCHYSGGCTRYAADCGACPVLGSTNERDLSTRLQARKVEYAAKSAAQLHIVCLSQDSLRAAQSSRVLRQTPITHIPFGVPRDTFRPHPRELAREVFGLPRGRRLIAFGALALNDPRKGADLLVGTLHRLAGKPLEFDLVTFGERAAALPLDPAIVQHHLGPLRDPTSVALALSAVDVFVSPSRQENGPTSVVEAVACGTPVAGFAIGLLPDLAAHGAAAFAAQPGNEAELADAIARAAALPSDDPTRRERVAQAADQIDSDSMAKRYVELYRRLSERGAGR